MKIVKCPECKNEKKVENNIKIPICYLCQKEMEVMIYGSYATSGISKSLNL